MSKESLHHLSIAEQIDYLYDQIVKLSKLEEDNKEEIAILKNAINKPTVIQEKK